MFDSARFKIVKSYWFLGALCLLLLNDFILKDLFHNWLTGKLSDFAGLFFFPLFFLVLFPNQVKTIFIGTIAFFIYWKSPLSNGLINLINGLGSYHLTRVIDYTDLLAFSILPLSYFIYSRRAKLSTVRINPAFSLSLAAFAMMSTSQEHNFVELNQQYTINKSVADLRLHLINIDPQLQGIHAQVSYLDNIINDSLSFNLFITDASLCQAIYLYPLVVGVDSTSSIIYFYDTEQNCRDRCGVIRRCDTSNSAAEIMQVVESNFVDFL